MPIFHQKIIIPVEHANVPAEEYYAPVEYDNLPLESPIHPIKNIIIPLDRFEVKDSSYKLDLGFYSFLRAQAKTAPPC